MIRSHSPRTTFSGYPAIVTTPILSERFPYRRGRSSAPWLASFGELQAVASAESGSFATELCRGSLARSLGAALVAAGDF
jgi:hypothetical protein